MLKYLLKLYLSVHLQSSRRLVLESWMLPAGKQYICRSMTLVLMVFQNGSPWEGNNAATAQLV